MCIARLVYEWHNLDIANLWRKPGAGMSKLQSGVPLILLLAGGSVFLSKVSELKVIVWSLDRQIIQLVCLVSGHVCLVLYLWCTTVCPGAR